MNPSSLAIGALILGIGLAVLTNLLCQRERSILKLPATNRRIQLLRGLCIVLAAVILAVAYQWASIQLNCLESPEVQPSPTGRSWRMLYHLTLIYFLIWATAVDFDCYMIPDAITIPGTLLGLLGACWIGEAQLAHLWVDWSYAIPQLRGPLIPDWYDSYRLGHALAWSLTGLFVGASLTFLARLISSHVLGQEAMGLGDVTLMAMIGSYLGWQAVTLVFLIAPLTGLTIGLLIRAVTGKTYLPYGPWLSIAAIIVLFSWSSLWLQTRLIFSDWISLSILGLVGTTAFVLLLWLLRLYKSIPTRGNSPDS